MSVCLFNFKLFSRKKCFFYIKQISSGLRVNRTFFSNIRTLFQKKKKRNRIIRFDYIFRSTRSNKKLLQSY